jgi:OOP family OmpA-OmpF porin
LSVLLAAVLAAVVTGATAASPTTDPLDKVQPTAQEIAESVGDVDLEVADLEIAPSITELEQEEQRGAATVVTLSADILFAFGSADLTPAARKAVVELGGRVASASGDVSVTGHTDAVGTDAFNLTLSQQRAAAVAAVLTEAIGDGSPRVVATGKGESQPIAANGDPDGAAQNRRVEVRFTG